MLFLVVSEPRPGSPSSVAAAAWQRYWPWAEVLIARGIIRSVHNRPQWARIRDTPEWLDTQAIVDRARVS